MADRDETARSPVDRSLDLDQGHLLPPAPDPERGPTVFPASAPRAIEWTAERLIAGGVVAFPTDTVYGLAASLAHEAAVARILAIKGRPPDKPIPVLLASPDDLDLVARDPDPRLVALAGRFWPGPLTVAVAARAGLPPAVVAADGTVGARVPNHFLAIELIERAGGAIAATSANRGGGDPARDAESALAALGPDVDLILDGGATPGGVPSTVVALAGGALTVVRDGAIPGEAVLAAWREILAGEGAAP
jgi:L-threonylcarbamoyladenylate synthase